MDLKERAWMCSQSLTVRTRNLPVGMWSTRLKKDSWPRHLSGRILKPSLWSSFVDEWTESLGDTHANPSHRTQNEKEKPTPDTFGLLYRGQLQLFDHDGASLRTSLDILPAALKTLATTWESWATSLRQEYLARKRLACPNEERDFSYWPTVTTAEADKISNRPNYGQLGLSNHPEVQGTTISRPKLKKDRRGHPKMRCQQDPDNPSTGGKPLGSLNPRWIELLLGLPVGWCLPSCGRPINPSQLVATTAHRNSGSSATPFARKPAQKPL